MTFLWYLLTLIFGLDVPQSAQNIERQAQSPTTTNNASGANAQARKGGGTGGIDKFGGHGPIIVVEDTHFKMGEQ